MKKNVSKIITTIVVFFIAVIITSVIINQGNTDMTTEMRGATYPVVYMQIDGEAVNFLRGYGSAMEGNYLRETITPLMEERALSFAVKKYGNQIEKLSFEVRSVDGERLVENTEIYNYVEEDDTITATVNIKDLIEKKL